MFPKTPLLIAASLVLSAVLAHAEAKIEAEEVAPTGPGVKYTISPHAVHLAAATLQGSRHVMLINGVAGPKFDELVWIKGEKFQVLTQMSHKQAVDGEMEASAAPVVFSDDGNRYAYVGRQGNEFVVICDGKELSRGPYTPTAVTSLSFTPGGKHLRYIETIATERSQEKRLVINGKKDPIANRITPRDVAWSPDGEHYAYRTHSADRGDHLIVDGREDPPGLGLAAKGTKFGWKYQPLFTGDSAGLITIRFVERPDPRPRKNYEKNEKKIWVPAVFFNDRLIVEAPVSVAREQYKFIAEPEEISVAPAGQNFVAVFDIGGSSYLLYFNERSITETRRIDSVAWSADGKRYAAHCHTPHQSQFMVIDGKKEPDYRSVSTLRVPEYWAPSRVFTADSSKSIYAAATDKAFLIVENEESDPYARIDEITLSEQGSHFGFIATESGGEKLVVIDGMASEPRTELSDLTFTPDGAHYAALSGDKEGQKLIVDGVEQAQHYGSDLARFSFSSDAGRNRHLIFSPDGNHFVYVTQLAPTGQDSKPHRAVCLDGKAEIPCGGALIHPFFTPDSQHLIWVAWNGYNVSSYSIYLDGKQVAQFESPDISYNLGGVTAKVGDFFARSPNAAQMGTDGVFTLLAPVGNAIKKIRVIPPGDTSLATFGTEAAAQKNAAEQKAKEESTPSRW